MPTSAAEPLLDVTALSTGYGKIIVLRGIDLTIGASEVVALLGPNGAGKTTLLRAVSGLLPWSGTVRRRSSRTGSGRAFSAPPYASGGGRNTISCLAESATTSGGFCSFMPWIAQNRS